MTARAYVVTVIRGGHRHQWTEGYASQQAAQDAGLDLLGTFHGVVSVRPLVELTEAEGARRFPHPLHKDAFTDAWRGWQDAQAEAAERNFDSTLTAAAKWAHNDRMALNLQIDRPGELERAHRALGV